MHISEGVLSVPVLISGWGLTLAGTAAGIKKIKNEDIPKVAILSSAFFVASLIHVPFGVTSVHLILNGLLGILLGWSAVPSILIALLMQAVLFQYGGLSSLGVNTVIMALPAVLSYYIFRKALRKKESKDQDIHDCEIKSISISKFWSNNSLRITSFFCGTFTIAVSALLLGIALALSGDEFILAAKLAVMAHIPVMVIEGIITSSSVLFLKKVKPEALDL